MNETRSGEMVSAQIGKMGVIDQLQTKNFSLVDGQCFNVKNDGTQPVALQVQLAGMNDGEFVETNDSTNKRSVQATNMFLVGVVQVLPIKLTNIVAGAVCFWQVWSMLENESSCNNARWAKIAQRILVDKTERHFDIDLRELKEKGGEYGQG
jgi:hypothetical protein